MQTMSAIYKCRIWNVIKGKLKKQKKPKVNKENLKIFKVNSNNNESAKNEQISIILKL